MPSYPWHLVGDKLPPEGKSCLVFATVDICDLVSIEPRVAHRDGERFYCACQLCDEPLDDVYCWKLIEKPPDKPKPKRKIKRLNKALKNRPPVPLLSLA